MTQREIEKILSELNALHDALRGRLMSPPAIQLYQRHLENLEYDAVLSKLREHARTSKFFPSPAELLPPADQRAWTGPGAPIREALELSEEREKLGVWFEKLEDNQKQWLRSEYPREANDWNRERVEGLKMEKLGKCFPFQLFLQQRANGEGGD